MTDKKEELRKLAESLGFSGREVIAFIVGAGITEERISKDGKLLYCENPSKSGYTEYWSDHKSSKSVLKGKLVNVEEIK